MFALRQFWQLVITPKVLRKSRVFTENVSVLRAHRFWKIKSGILLSAGDVVKAGDGDCTCFTVPTDH